MNSHFFPPWKVFDTADTLSEDISCFFMQSGGIPRTPIEKPPKATIVKSIKPQPLKEIRLDWRYWAFWTAWVAFHGMEEYQKIPETEQLAVWIQEKTKMSDWFQDNFMVAKREIAKHWDKIFNLEMEESITGLVTDADESESGLKTLLLCWTYYSMTLVDKGAVECIWVVPGKSLYYSFSHGSSDGEAEQGVKKGQWGIFMDLLESGGGKRGGETGVEGAPPRKPLKPQRRFLFRSLDAEEIASIHKNMVEMKSVNRAFASISKYTLKDLVEIGGKLGLQPPRLSALDEKGAMKLDLVAKVLEAERELGVIRGGGSGVGGVIKKEVEKMEKWKKTDWYERLEEYCAVVF
jgi:hypothetical protein